MTRLGVVAVIADSTSTAGAAAPPPVILVDEDDRELGLEDKLAAHERGVLHRAVSVFAFDATGAMLVQRRAEGKYHSGGLWSNSACTHPRAGETLEEAARRCMREELGVECATLQHLLSFIYRTPVGPALVEHELDHLFVATVDATPAPAASEVSALRHMSLERAAREASADPGQWTPWFPLALARLRAHPTGVAAGGGHEG